MIKDTITHFDSIFPVIQNTLHTSLIHNDINPGNVLREQELKITGILDFTELCHTYRICEVGIALAYLMQISGSNYLDIGCSFTRVYARALLLESDVTMNEKTGLRNLAAVIILLCIPALCLTIRGVIVDKAKKIVGKMEAGDAYFDQSKYQAALNCYQEALKLSDIHEPTTAKAFFQMGKTENELGKYDDAIDSFKKAMSIEVSLKGGSHPDVAYCLNYLGNIMHSVGDYAAAIDYYERASEIFTNSYGPDSLDANMIRNNLGIVFNSIGNYEKALENNQKAMKSALKIYGEDSEIAAICHNNIGKTYASLQKYQMALDHYENALRIDRKIHGDQHPVTARDYRFLGAVMHSLKRYADALDYREKALEILIKAFGPDLSIVNIERIQWGAIPGVLTYRPTF